MTFDVVIKTTRPQVTETNIRNGILPRYFVARANQIKDRAYEVSRRDYEKLKSNPYIVSTFMNWIITGKLDDYTIMVNTGFVLGYGGMEEIIIPGVLTQNATSVRFASKEIPAIKNLVVDFKEFYVGNTSSG